VRFFCKLTILPALLLVGSCAQCGIVRGDGNTVSDVRELDAFDAIETNTLVNVDVRIGSPQKVEISCDENVVE